MDPNKPVEVQEENEEIYTPGQRAVLRLLQWGAWTAALTAILYVMHS